MKKYSVELTIVGARNIKVGDIQTSDGYVKFQLNGQKYKTHVVTSTLNPDWNDTFQLELTKDEDVQFMLYDYDTFTSDDYLGQITWKVPEMYHNRTQTFIEEWDTQGTLYFSVKCLEGGSEYKLSNSMSSSIPYVLIITPKLLSGFKEIYSFTSVPSQQDETPYTTQYKKLRENTFENVNPLMEKTNKSEVTSYPDVSFHFKTSMTKDQRSDYIHLSKNDITEFKQYYYCKAYVNEKIEFMISTSYNKGTDYLSYSYIVPDYRDGDSECKRIRSKAGTSLCIDIKCISGIYYGYAPQFFPLDDETVPLAVYKYELSIIKGKNMPGRSYIVVKSSDSKPKRTLVVSGSHVQIQYGMNIKAKPRSTLVIEEYSCTSKWVINKEGSNTIEIPAKMGAFDKITKEVEIGKSKVQIELRRVRGLSSRYQEVLEKEKKINKF